MRQAPSVAHARTRPHAGSLLPLPGPMMAQDPQPDGLYIGLCQTSEQFGEPHATTTYPPRAAFAAGQPQGCRVTLTVPGPRVAAAALLWESRPWWAIGLLHAVNSNVVSSPAAPAWVRESSRGLAAWIRRLARESAYAAV
jgi:hypothetical protein